MKNYIKNVIVAAIGCSFAFMLLFIFVILFAKSGIILNGTRTSAISLLKESPLVGYTYIPNVNFIGRDDKGEYTISIHINNIGFRGRDYNQKDIQSEKQKIMVLGDSFAMGAGVDKPFSEFIEDMLNNSRKEPVWVYNFGLMGYGTHNELGVLQKYGEDLMPSLVIVTFYLGNDFRENLVSLSNVRIINGYLVNNVFAWADKEVVLTDDELAKYVDIATKHKLHQEAMIQMIRVDKFGEQMVFIEKTARQLLINFPSLKRLIDYFKQKIPQKILLLLRMTTPEYYKVTDREIEITKRYLKEIRENCQRLNITLMLAVIPEHLSNDANVAKRHAIKQICKELDIQHVIDVFDFFKNDMDKYYLKMDDHLSQSGHAVVAECIVAYIQKHNLLEKILPKID